MKFASFDHPAPMDEAFVASELNRVAEQRRTTMATPLSDPTALTRAQLDALQMLSKFKRGFSRSRMGWRPPEGMRLIRRETADALIFAQAARIAPEINHRLVITGHGRNILAVIEQRKENRR